MADDADVVSLIHELRDKHRADALADLALSLAEDLAQAQRLSYCPKCHHLIHRDEPYRTETVTVKVHETCRE